MAFYPYLLNAESIIIFGKQQHISSFTCCQHTPVIQIQDPGNIN